MPRLKAAKELRSASEEGTRQQCQQSNEQTPLARGSCLLCHDGTPKTARSGEPASGRASQRSRLQVSWRQRKALWCETVPAGILDASVEHSKWEDLMIFCIFQDIAVRGLRFAMPIPWWSYTVDTLGIGWHRNMPRQLWSKEGLKPSEMGCPQKVMCTLHVAGSFDIKVTLILRKEAYYY